MLITNFASGELSQNLNGRVDLRQYYQGAAKIENFEIIPTGGIKRRVGTQRIGQLSGNSRIIPFIVDRNAVYVFEIGLSVIYHTYEEVQNPVESELDTYYIKNQDNTYSPATVWSVAITYYKLVENGDKPGVVKIWKQNVLGVYEVVQSIYCDYASYAEIKEIQFAQNYDMMVFVHRSYKPHIFKMNAQGLFDYSAMEFDFTPDVKLDDDFDYVMICSGDDFPVYSATADGHAHFEYKKLVGEALVTVPKDYGIGISDYWCIMNKTGKLYKYDRANDRWPVYGTDPDIESDLFITPNKYPGCVAFFNNRLFFASTYLGRQKIWGSAAPDAKDVRYNDFSTYKKYVTVNKVVKEADAHIFTCSIAQADIDTIYHRTTLRGVTQDFTVTGTLAEDITKYFVSSSVVPVGTKVISVTSNTMVIDTDKIALVFDPGDEEHEAETVKDNLVMSIQLWRSMDSVSAEDYAFTVVANNIVTADCSFNFELASDQNDAIMFLSSNQFLAAGTESSIWCIQPGISALSINAVMQGRYGSDAIQGQAIETATVYFAQGRKGIREFYYDGDAQAFKTNNIAILADHILRESAVVDFDYVTNPYSKIVVVRSDGVCAQMLYDKTNGIMAWNRIVMKKGKITSCAVTRGDDEYDFIFFVVKDGDNYYLELLNFKQEIFLDSWKVYEDSTLGYSAGAILYNSTTGKTCPYNDIPEDFINLGDVVYIGYPFTSYIKSMPVIGNDPSKRVRITSLLVRFLESYKPVMKCPDLPDEKFNSITQVPYSGIAKATYPGQTDHDVSFELVAEDVKPVNILSVDAQTA